MTALILRSRVRQDIQSKVDRVLKELGSPEPPLRLEDVRELLKLDQSFFSSEADGLLAKAFSRLKRAGKQILRRPTILRDAITEFDLRALYLPDQKRILIDDKVPKPKHRWLEAHEIGHDLLPWHHDVMLGDDSVTPTPSTHAKIEAEANYAAGELLFLSDRFSRECRDVAPNIASAQAFMKRYANTLTTTVWRMIEHAGEDLPMLGAIGLHPCEFGKEKPNFRHLIPSVSFARQFDFPNVETLIEIIQAYAWRNRGPLGNGEAILSARDGSRHAFQFETFYNGYDSITLGCHQGEVPLIVSVGSFDPLPS